MSVDHPLESIARGDAAYAHLEWASWRIGTAVLVS
jgi:hypothetical protein